MKTPFVPLDMQPMLYFWSFHIKVVAQLIALGDVVTLGGVYIYGQLTGTVYHEAEYHHLLVQWVVVALFVIGSQKHIVALLVPFMLYFFFYLLLTFSAFANICYNLASSPTYAKSFGHELQKFLPWLSDGESYVFTSGIIASVLTIRMICFEILVRCFMNFCVPKKASDGKLPLINHV